MEGGMAAVLQCRGQKEQQLLCIAREGGTACLARAEVLICRELKAAQLPAKGRAAGLGLLEATALPFSDLDLCLLLLWRLTLPERAPVDCLHSPLAIWQAAAKGYADSCHKILLHHVGFVYRNSYTSCSIRHCASMLMRYTSWARSMLVKPSGLSHSGCCPVSDDLLKTKL